MVVGVVTAVSGAFKVTLDRVLLRCGGPKIQRGLPPEPGVLHVWHSALAPLAHLEAVPVLILPLWAGQGVVAGPDLGEVGTVGAPVHGRGQDHPSPVLEASAAGPAADRPVREGGYHAVVWAGDEAGLLCRGPRGKELAYALRHGRAVGLAHALYQASLDPVLCGHALGCPQFDLIGEVGREDAGTPLRHGPLKELLVPLAHLEAPPLALGFLCMGAVGVVGGPTLCVNAPYRPGLDPPGATLLTHTPAPLTCRMNKKTELLSKFPSVYHF